MPGDPVGRRVTLLDWGDDRIIIEAGPEKAFARGHACVYSA